MDQLVPYWNPATQQFLGPGGVAGGSVEIFTGQSQISTMILVATQATGATASIPLAGIPKSGRIVDVRMAAIGPITGNDTLTAQVNLDGAPILSGAMTLNSTVAARAQVAGVLASPPVLINNFDFLEVALTYTHGTGTAPTGVVVQVAIEQDVSGALGSVPLGIATRAGVIADARAAAITPITGNDTYAVDIKRTPAGGSTASILSAPISLTSSEVARASVVGTLAGGLAAVAAGDFFEATVTPTHGTGAQPLGVVFQVQILQN